MRFYLASTSPARLATLRAAGIEPILLAPDVDEDALSATASASGTPSVQELVQLLARAKAESVLARHGADEFIDGVILGGDSLFELEGTVYGKPHRPDIARDRWNSMRGASGFLHSGHWVIDHRNGTAGAARGDVSTARVSFSADIDDDEIDAYIATGEPLTVAGAFTIDGAGSAFITRVEGDPHAVVGLSVSLTRTLVRELGIPWHALWNRDRFLSAPAL